MTSCSC